MLLCYNFKIQQNEKKLIEMIAINFLYRVNHISNRYVNAVINGQSNTQNDNDSSDKFNGKSKIIAKTKQVENGKGNTSKGWD